MDRKLSLESRFILAGKQLTKFNHQSLVDMGVEFICGMRIADDKLLVATCGKGVVSIGVQVAK